MEHWPPNNYAMAAHFCCNCSQPIKLDPSLLENGPYDGAIAAVVESTEAGSQSTGAPTANIPTSETTGTRPPPPPRIPSSKDRPYPSSQIHIPIYESFVMLSKSQVSPLLSPPISGNKIGRAGQHADQQRGSLSYRLKTAGKLFDIMSQVSMVDHPFCQDCADELIVKLEKRLSDVRKEKDAYDAFLANLIAEQEDASGTQITEEDINALKVQETRALELLRELEAEKTTLGEEFQELKSEMEELDAQKNSHWQQVNEYENILQRYQDEKDSVEVNSAYVTKQLEALKKTNVYNDTFRIWHDGPFGTINGFRMGRLPNQSVDWSEINAAMGQACLLLETMANNLGFVFKTYRLVPLGSFSRIERIDGDKGVYDLYGSGDLKGMLFWNRRFDNALVAFLTCLQQIGDYAEEKDPKFRLPYRISKDKIGDTSIKLQFNQDEAWTKALKYMLINLKWILAFCCTRMNSRSTPNQA
ncbi:autophagy protein Apg6-domain-containing protein [Phlyctochytrium arcticum]|nr:autophagy protein Apg6-domain-containing protein [Phlyctochytrium arcticum]